MVRIIRNPKGRAPNSAFPVGIRVAAGESDRVNVDHILSCLNRAGADYLLIGGMNFLLNHEPILTFDVDVWVDDTPSNLERVNQALRELNAEWGTTSENFRPVPENPSWLNRQSVFCLFTPSGDLDIFRSVRGLEGRYQDCRSAAAERMTPAGVPYRSLSDRDMLTCQLVLEDAERKLDRIRILRQCMEDER